MNIVLNNTALCLTHISFEKNNLIIIAIICTFIVYIFFVFSGTQFEKNEETKEEVDLVIRFLWHFFLRPKNWPLTHLSHSESRNFLFRVKVETRHALSAWPTYLERNGHWKWRAHSSCHCSDVGHLELSRLGFQGLLTATKASYVHKLTRLGSACFWILMLMMMLMIAMLMMRIMSIEQRTFFFMKIVRTRPSVNYAKDWLKQFFLMPGLVYTCGCYHYGHSRNIFPCIRPFSAWWQPNNQPA